VIGGPSSNAPKAPPARRPTPARAPSALLARAQKPPPAKVPALSWAAPPPSTARLGCALGAFAVVGLLGLSVGKAPEFWGRGLLGPGPGRVRRSGEVRRRKCLLGAECGRCPVPHDGRLRQLAVMAPEGPSGGLNRKRLGGKSTRGGAVRLQ